jgi:hypothetical protein
VVHTIKRLSELWRTVLTADGRVISDPIPIRSGIFQGDSLSPILFITSLNPLSWYIQKRSEGIVAGNGRRINHLFFVDDWKLFGKKKEEVESLASEVERLSRSIGLQLNEEKCAVAIKVDGRVMPHPIQRNESDLLSKFATLGDSSELTKYLGILQSGSHNESSIREVVRETVLKRVDEVLKVEAS